MRSNFQLVVEIYSIQFLLDILQESMIEELQKEYKASAFPKFTFMKEQWQMAVEMI